MLTRSKEEITIFTKEELMANTAPLALVRTNQFDVIPVIRNVVEGDDAVTRNTVVKRPFLPLIGFDLHYRFVLNGPKRNDNILNGMHTRQPNTSKSLGIHPSSDDAAYELLDRLRRSTTSTPVFDVRPLSYDHTLRCMVMFEKVFGRFPRDSQKANVVRMLPVLNEMFYAGIKTNFPIKQINKFKKYYAEMMDQNEACFEFLFKIALVANNFDQFMDKIMKELVLTITEQERAHQLSSFRNVSQGDLEPRWVKKRFADNFVRHLMNVAQHLPAKLSAEEEAFFLKYFKVNRLHDLISLLPLINEPTFPASGNWSVYKNFLSLAGGLRLKAEVVQRLEKKGFSWDKLETLLPNKDVTLGKSTVRMLDAQDATAIALGQITHCCQGLYGAGESCMFEGLVNPHSGFIVFEENNSIIAQSWVWEAQNGALVLDNIEFGDFKNTNSIIDVLIKWLEESPYENIQVGKGYMQIRLNAPEVELAESTWFKQKVWSNRLYTDAQERLWLKKDNEVVLSK